MRLAVFLSLVFLPCFSDASSVIEENWERHLGVVRAPLWPSCSDLLTFQIRAACDHTPSFVPKKKKDRPSDKNNDQKITPVKKKTASFQRDPQGFIYSK
ncbi:MAG: hypothetical protein H2057_05120 [Alphaproteobacteria bacterium]|nr:hypothetical protein [Alphaproteobacteria bacterium]